MASAWFRLLLTGAVIFCTIATARPLPVHAPVPGGIAVIDLGAARQPRPKVAYQGRPVLVTDNEGRWTALVGIPLNTEPGLQSIEMVQGNRTMRLPFRVEPKEYPAQYIELPKGKERYVTPPPEDLARIERESPVLDRILAVWRDTDQVDTDFHLPVDGSLGSPFGLRRYFNGEPRNPHSGLDLVAPKGTPVKAPAPAKVIGTGDFFYTGKAVFLDHGQGLLSGYFHLDSIAVKPGQWVKRGDILGTVGATGRVTGPHLHMNVYLNGTKVDPELFLRRHLQAAH
ncbi:MAG TPA: M23 family metallopeptidase [Methylothermaceae bacterium]|nr:M23 family metallopeptidase [Methylothermaceae bacterium]